MKDEETPDCRCPFCGDAAEPGTSSPEPREKKAAVDTAGPGTGISGAKRRDSFVCRPCQVKFTTCGKCGRPFAETLERCPHCDTTGDSARKHPTSKPAQGGN